VRTPSGFVLFQIGHLPLHELVEQGYGERRLAVALTPDHLDSEREISTVNKITVNAANNNKLAPSDPSWGLCRGERVFGDVGITIGMLQHVSRWSPRGDVESGQRDPRFSNRRLGGDYEQSRLPEPAVERSFGMEHHPDGADS
jgi:hypothetical protein